ncbi:MAG: MGMT family protein [Candidatus Bathyarchaeia archaeon]
MKSMTLSKIPSLVLAPGVIGAVARGCVSNPATLLIPCHRVVRRTENLVGIGCG